MYYTLPTARKKQGKLCMLEMVQRQTSPRETRNSILIISPNQYILCVSSVTSPRSNVKHLVCHFPGFSQGSPSSTPTGSPFRCSRNVYIVLSLSLFLFHPIITTCQRLYDHRYPSCASRRLQLIKPLSNLTNAIVKPPIQHLPRTNLSRSSAYSRPNPPMDPSSPSHHPSRGHAHQ